MFLIFRYFYMFLLVLLVIDFSIIEASTSEKNHPQKIVLTNCNIISCADKKLQKNMTIIIEGRKIISENEKIISVNNFSITVFL